MDQPKSPKSKTCFVIGPIGTDGSETRKKADMLLHVVIKPALLGNDLNISVKRADEDQDPGTIHARLVTDIINSDLVVVDFTGLNANAMYELGIRHMTVKPTIHMAELGTQLPFDNFQQRTIFFDTTDIHSLKTASELLNRYAKNAFSPDYVVTSPVTHANNTFNLRSNEDPRDSVIANFEERLIDIEQNIKKLEKQNISYSNNITTPLRNKLLDIDITENIEENYKRNVETFRSSISSLIRKKPSKNEIDINITRKAIDLGFEDLHLVHDKDKTLYVYATYNKKPMKLAFVP